MSVNYEYSGIEPSDDSYHPTEKPIRLELVNGLFVEADMVEATDNEEKLAEPEPELAPDEESDETNTEYRTREERLLRLYQERARAQIGKLLGDIALDQPLPPPRYRKNHRITGEEGKKGRRGL